MLKQSQSLIDFINYLPIQSILRHDILTTKEAESLMKIWECDREGDSVLVSDMIDPLQVANLTSKGLIKSKFATTPKSEYYKMVDITDKGKEIIRNMVLRGEKSSFDKTQKLANIKTASRQEQSNWLQKLWKWK